MSADSSALCVDHAHPALPGHFPGSPVVPGVVLLSEVLADLHRRLPQVRVLGIKKLKFLRMLLPGQEFSVEFGAPTAISLRFKCWRDDVLLAEGNFALEASKVEEPAQPSVAP